MLRGVIGRRRHLRKIMIGSTRIKGMQIDRKVVGIGILVKKMRKEGAMNERREIVRGDIVIVADEFENSAAKSERD